MYYKLYTGTFIFFVYSEKHLFTNFVSWTDFAAKCRIKGFDIFLQWRIFYENFSATQIVLQMLSLGGSFPKKVHFCTFLGTNIYT